MYHQVFFNDYKVAYLTQVTRRVFCQTLTKLQIDKNISNLDEIDRKAQALLEVTIRDTIATKAVKKFIKSLH